MQSWWTLIESEERTSWSKIYTTACKEGNCSPHLKKLHPDLKLRKPTDCELRNDLLQTGDQPGAQHQEMPQNFDIPADIQFQILKHFFHFKGRVVHAISRLDPHHRAEEVPLNRFEKPTYLHRLHVGKDAVSITFTPEPNVFLAPLLVCRRWHFWGSHIFYGENTFAFSSLGE